jgi:hypothetical protein
MRYEDLIELLDEPLRHQSSEMTAEALRATKRWAAPAYAHARAAECLFYADREGEAFWEAVEEELLEGGVPAILRD